MTVGLLLIGLASISWGTTGATMSLLMRDTGISPLLVGWARLAVATPFLLLAAAGARGASRTAPGRRRWPAGRAWAARALPAYAVLGLAMALYQACYFWAVALTGVAVAALLAICSAPIAIALFSAVFLREGVRPAVRVSLGMAVAGTALLIVGPHGLAQPSAHFGAGAVLALGAGVSYAVFAVTAKAVLTRAAPIAVAATTFSLAALFLSPVLAWEPDAPSALAAGWPLLLYLGIGPTAIAYALFTMGLRRVPATAAGIASLLEPLTATLLGVVAFGEALGAAGGAGAALLLAGLATLIVAQRRPAGPVTGCGRSRGSPPG